MVELSPPESQRAILAAQRTTRRGRRERHAPYAQAVENPSLADEPRASEPRDIELLLEQIARWLADVAQEPEVTLVPEHE